MYEFGGEDSRSGMKKSTSNEVVCRACLDDLPEICRIVTDAARHCGMEDGNLWKLETSIDEACTNIACYGYRGNPNGTITIRWECRGDNFLVTIEDNGMPFDQTQPTHPDFTTNICQRKVGGLGRYIMRQFLDGMDYRRKNNTNTLILVKKLCKNSRTPCCSDSKAS